MPFVNIHVTGTLTEEKKDLLKTRLGELITILPGKQESGLMVDIADNHSMYYQGSKLEKCAFVDVRLYKESPMEEKGKFATALFETLEEITGVPRTRVYLNFLEMNTWGSKGTFH